MRPTLIESIKAHAGLLFGLLAVMWGVEILDFLLPFIDLDRFGIRPRTAAGLLGIPLSPFLHAGFPHLISNSIPFLVLGALVMASGMRAFAGVSLAVIVFGGFGVWLFGRGNSIHVGASGLIFGYLGFLLSRGVFERSARWMLISIGLLIVYGGVIHGVLPGKSGVSWLGHLCGFLAGIGVARLMFRGGVKADDDMRSSA
jgi:membrane associated rhomboid family serine protease